MGRPRKPKRRASSTNKSAAAEYKARRQDTEQTPSLSDASNILQTVPANQPISPSGVQNTTPLVNEPAATQSPPRPTWHSITHHGSQIGAQNSAEPVYNFGLPPGEGPNKWHSPLKAVSTGLSKRTDPAPLLPVAQQNLAPATAQIYVTNTSLPFSKRVVQEAGHNLFILLPDPNDSSRIEQCEINLATLQRMNIHAIQRELVNLTKIIVENQEMRVDDDDPELANENETRRETRGRSRGNEEAAGEDARDHNNAGSMGKDRDSEKGIDTGTGLHPYKRDADVVGTSDAGHKVFDSQAHKVRELMKEYCTAWRDWDLIVERTSDAITDPFRISTYNRLSRDLLRDAGFLDAGMIEKQPGGHPRKALQLRSTLKGIKKTDGLPGGPRHSKLRQEMLRDATQRFFIGLGGGIALIAPMLLMYLHHTTLTVLLTSSISVVLFSLIISLTSSGLVPEEIALDASPKDILTATAAYAAVLVVFVGTSA